MNTYLLLFVIAICSSLVLTPLVRRICDRYNLLDKPRDGRRVHKKPVPRLGGLAIFASACLALAVLLLLDNSVTHSLKAQGNKLSLGLTLLWMVGISNAFNLIDGVDGLATAYLEILKEPVRTLAA